MKLVTLVEKAVAKNMTIESTDGYVMIRNKSVAVEIFHKNGRFVTANRGDVQADIATAIRTVKACAQILGIH